ncbi:hypothetical protein JKP88DRAFT_138786, partial [Tribonema minus]
MRVLQGELLRPLCGSPLNELDFLHLDRYQVERLHGRGLAECKRLRHLRLARNALVGIPKGALGTSNELWLLDFSRNCISQIEDLSKFAALGSVDLSHNDLSWVALRALARTHVLQLNVAGNPKLQPPANAGAGGHGSDTSTETKRATRSAVLATLPLVWVLNGEFVTAAERKAACQE